MRGSAVAAARTHDRVDARDRRRARRARRRAGRRRPRDSRAARPGRRGARRESPAASHTARPPASRAGSTGPPGAAMPERRAGRDRARLDQPRQRVTTRAGPPRSRRRVRRRSRRAGPASEPKPGRSDMPSSLRFSGVRSLKRAYLPSNWSLIVPVGPLRCLATISSAIPRFSSLRVVDLVAVDERDQVGVLLDRARLAQVAHVGPALVGIALLGAAVELRERHHRDVELLREHLEAVADLGDLEVLAVGGRVAVRELEVVEHHEVEPVLGVQAPALRLHLEDRDRAGCRPSRSTRPRAGSRRAGSACSPRRCRSPCGSS